LRRKTCAVLRPPKITPAQICPTLANYRRSGLSLAGPNLPDPGEFHPEPAESRPRRIYVGRKSEFWERVGRILAGHDIARPTQICVGREYPCPAQIFPTLEGLWPGLGWRPLQVPNAGRPTRPAGSRPGRPSPPADSRPRRKTSVGQAPWRILDPGGKTSVGQAPRQILDLRKKRRSRNPLAAGNVGRETPWRPGRAHARPWAKPGKESRARDPSRARAQARPKPKPGPGPSRARGTQAGPGPKPGPGPSLAQAQAGLGPNSKLIRHSFDGNRINFDGNSTVIGNSTVVRR
jgi:hypothetical protein